MPFPFFSPPPSTVRASVCLTYGACVNTLPTVTLFSFVVVVFRVALASPVPVAPLFDVVMPCGTLVRASVGVQTKRKERRAGWAVPLCWGGGARAHPHITGVGTRREVHEAVSSRSAATPFFFYLPASCFSAGNLAQEVR